MNSPTAADEIPGWFGKIPALGDFATRRLPVSFVLPWDQWLSAELADARDIAAATWATTYRQAPILCFALGASAIDERAWCGILVPSFDRVGREFPLTIAQNQSRHAAARDARQWWSALVTAGRRALEPVCGADGLDTALAVIDGIPQERTQPAEGMSAWWRWSTEDASDVATENFNGLPRGVCFRKLLTAR
jgi:type VI secretion system protein ImpM